MPAVSQKQQKLFAVAEHNPGALNQSNKRLGNLPHQVLHDYAATPRKTLPEQVGPRKRKDYGEA